MQVRTQIAVVAIIALGWSAGNASNVSPMLADAQRASRMTLRELENAVARNSDDVVAARALAERYVEQGMHSLALETMSRMTPAVQQDARVTLQTARALERQGDVEAAAARVNGALNRCHALSEELAPSRGCDMRTRMELTLEADALGRMRAWGITPVSDPQRAALAHEMSVRPIRLAPSL